MDLERSSRVKVMHLEEQTIVKRPEYSKEIVVLELEVMTMPEIIPTCI